MRKLIREAGKYGAFIGLGLLLAFSLAGCEREKPGPNPTPVPAATEIPLEDTPIPSVPTPMQSGECRVQESFGGAPITRCYSVDAGVRTAIACPDDPNVLPLCD